MKNARADNSDLFGVECWLDNRSIGRNDFRIVMLIGWYIYSYKFNPRHCTIMSCPGTLTNLGGPVYQDWSFALCPLHKIS